MTSVFIASASSIAAPTTQPFAPVGREELLPNAHMVTDKVISGAQPEGDAAFKSLAEMGIKTIISVDGAKPDVAAARKYGMRYVHLPFGYDGVPADQGKAIAKAIDQLPGPIYLHCHHGKHRSAAAVAVACVMDGTLKPEQAESVLKTFGTGANYKGLWKSALDARPMNPAELKAVNVEFVEVAKISDLAELMVSTDEHFDHLKEIQKAGWTAPKDHPDLDPPHVALMVEEHLRETARLETVKHEPEEFRTILTTGETAMQTLAKVLASKPVDTAAADAAFKTAAQSCTACHKAYRD